MEILMKPIGYIKSTFSTRDDAPRQSILSGEQIGKLEMLPEFAPGIEDLRPGQHIVVLFYFHESKGYKLKTRARGIGDEKGIFSLRSPNRPNGIGMSIVKIIDIEDETITFEGVDMLNGTPVLDIKPYVADLNPQ